MLCPSARFACASGVWRERLIDLTTAGDALEWTSGDIAGDRRIGCSASAGSRGGRSDLRGLARRRTFLSVKSPHDHDAKGRRPVHRLWILGANRGCDTFQAVKNINMPTLFFIPGKLI